MSRIQVKAKQDAEWPGVQGVFRESDFLILVDFAGKGIGESPDIFVLSSEDWKRIVARKLVEIPGLEVSGENRVKHPDGWGGLNLTKADMDGAWRSAWEKITTCHLQGTGTNT
jgi:hypothetical protein